MKTVVRLLILSLVVLYDAISLQAQNTNLLKVSPDGHFLQYKDGKPFFYLGDTAWELFHRLNRDEANQYLQDRAKKGFTVIQAVVLSELNGLTVPNANGDLPLIDKDPTRPNEAYFKHVDYIVQQANKLGLFIGMLPSWGRYWRDGDSKIFTPESARIYGRFLGKRYKDDGIIWILGGDSNIRSKDEREVINSLAEGLREGDGGNHLITFHPRGPGQSSLQLNDAPWLDFNMSQSSHAARNHDTGLYAARDRKLTPTRPTLDGEPRYEGIPIGFYLKGHSPLLRFDDDDVRQAAWWSVMAGACGHTYGNNNIWQMWQPGRQPAIDANIPWYEALDHPGARQMGLMRHFMEANDFENLVPDQKIILDGPMDGPSKIKAELAKDSTRIVVYSSRGESFMLDQGLINTPTQKQSWFDPRYGAIYEFRTEQSTGYQTFTPPTSGHGQDWVLVIETVKN
jgi:hypothetical protein